MAAKELVPHCGAWWPSLAAVPGRNSPVVLLTGLEGSLCSLPVYLWCGSDVHKCRNMLSCQVLNAGFLSVKLCSEHSSASAEELFRESLKETSCDGH